MQFSREEQERYSRHFTLSQVGRQGQIKLKSAKVLIVGTGGLGSPIAHYLTGAGVGEISVVDPDKVSLSNIHRQVLFTTEDIGLPKVEVAQSRLKKVNPEVRIHAIQESFSKSNASALVSNHDFVIDGTDNFETRYLINDFCIQENKAFIFGALSRFDAQVAVFNYNEGPCYRCLYPNAPPLEAVANCSEAGVLGSLPGTVGTLMATEALKLILGIGELLSGKILIYDSLRAEMQTRSVKRRSDCRACGKIGVSSFGEVAKFAEDLHRENWHRIHDFFVIDVRSINEFIVDHLPEATNIALPQLRDSLAKLPLDRDILLVCKSGKRSDRAAAILSESGFKNLFQLQGGMDYFNECK